MGRGESVGDHIRSQRRENRSDDLASERWADSLKISVISLI